MRKAGERRDGDGGGEVCTGATTDVYYKYLLVVQQTTCVRTDSTTTVTADEL